MTGNHESEYYGLCPDGRRDAFERGAQQIAKIASWSDEVRRSKSPPSEVKGELKQFSKVLRSLSLEAQSSLWVMGATGSSYSPISYLIERVEIALNGIPDGRPKTDEVRHYLGTHAAALWCSHGGDIKASEFEVLLQNLIEKADFDGEGKVRIDSLSLAKQMRKEYENCDPPRWPRP
jgi:hypothetical protein